MPSPMAILAIELGVTRLAALLVPLAQVLNHGPSPRAGIQVGGYTQNAGRLRIASTSCAGGGVRKLRARDRGGGGTSPRARRHSLAAYLSWLR